MKKFVKFICLFMTFSFLCCSIFGCNTTQKKKPEDEKEQQQETPEENYTMTLDCTYNGSKIDLLMPKLREYYNNRSVPERLSEMLNEQENLSKNNRLHLDKQNEVVFSWKSTGEEETFTITFASDKELKNVLFTYETEDNYVDELGVFTPGVTYYYQVEGSVTGKSPIDYFTTKNTPVRYISAGAVMNMRDLGGWKGLDNKKVKYGMIYRGAALDGFEKWDDSYAGTYMESRGTSRLDDFAMMIFNDYLKMKGEIDLRGVPGDIHTNPAFGGDSKYLCQVANVNLATIWQDPGNVSCKNAIKEYFAFLANEENYPIYFHCNGGADRTGALAFLINGLLGVSYNELAVDYEITSYSPSADDRVRSRATYEKGGTTYYALESCCAELYKKYKTNDLQQAIESYILDCGVTEAQIQQFRDIMLG